MEAGRRRTTLASYQQESQTGVPMVPMSMQQGKRVFSGGSQHQQSFGRQSLMPGAPSAAAGPSGGRFSMAVPQRVVSGGGASSMRQSMVPGMMSSQQQQHQPFASSSQEQQHHFGPTSSRQSSQGYNSLNLLAPGTVGRGSQMYSSSSNNNNSHQHQLGVASVARHDGYLRSSMSQAQPHSSQQQSQQSSQGYAPPSIRRSSTGRRQSTNPAHAPIVQHFVQAQQRPPKDPRPVRDRAFQARCQNEILDFLRNSNYPDAHSLSGRSLAQPTGKEFANIFRYLYALYEPSHRPDPKKKHEDEVLYCIRASGYPFADSISKSHIQAVGTAMSWPGIIAMLHWLVNSIKAREQVLDNYDEVRIDASAPSRGVEGYERPQAKTEFWAEYLSGLYPAFLASEDYDAQPYAERLEERFEVSNEQSRTKVSNLKEECEQLQAELDKLERSPSQLDVKRKEQQDCEKDMNAINKYVAGLQDKSVRLDRQIEEFKRRVGELESTLADKETERHQLKQQVEAQGLSDHEIQKLTTDRHQLDEANRVTSAKLAEAVQKSHENELSLSRAFADVEKLTERYHEIASRLGLLPTGPEGFEDVDFAQELNSAAATPSGIVPDCITKIRPALVELKKATSKRRYANENECLKLEEELGRLADQLTEVNEVLAEAENKHDSIQRELTSAKDAHAAFVDTSGASIDRLSKTNAELRNHVTGALVAADQQLQALENERTRVLADAERIRAENQDAFANQIFNILAWKEHISKRFDEMLEAVESS